MTFPPLIPTQSDQDWPLVRVQTPLPHGQLYLSYICDKHQVEPEALATWLGTQTLTSACDLQKVKHTLYQELLPKALQVIYVSGVQSLTAREVQPGYTLAGCLKDVLNAEITKRTVY